MEMCFFYKDYLYRWDLAGADYENGVIHGERLEFNPDLGEWFETGTWEQFNPVEVLGLLTASLSGVTEAVKAHAAKQEQELESVYAHLTRKAKKRGAENA